MLFLTLVLTPNPIPLAQFHECSVLWKTPLFSEPKQTLSGSKVAGQGVGATKAYRRKPTIEPSE